jgi:predicted dienelactone hydrolase
MRGCHSLLLGVCLTALVACGGENAGAGAGADAAEVLDGAVDVSPDQAPDGSSDDIPDVLGEVPDAIPDEVTAEDVWVAPDPLAQPVEAPGPYGIGFREDEIVYDVLPDGAPRTLRAAIWYPTLDTPGDEPTLYYPGSMKRPEVMTHAEPAPHAGWPVLVFSHGYAGFAENSYFLTEHFASHGWLVLAMDHTGNTIEELGASVESAMYAYRPQDVSAGIDFLEGLPEGDPLRAKGDTSRVAVSGHSYGGYTTLVVSGATFDMEDIVASCEDGTGHGAFCTNLGEDLQAVFAAGLLDQRVAVGIPMAPGAAKVIQDGVASIAIPMLQFTGGLDGQTTNDGSGDPLWQALEGSGHVRVNIETAGHQSFTIVCTWFPLIGAGDGCGEGFIDSLEVHRIVNTYALAFARKHILDDGGVDDYLDGTTVVDPEVTLVTKP